MEMSTTLSLDSSRFLEMAFMSCESSNITRKIAASDLSAIRNMLPCECRLNIALMELSKEADRDKDLPLQTQILKNLTVLQKPSFAKCRLSRLIRVKNKNKNINSTELEYSFPFVQTPEIFPCQQDTLA